MTTATATRPLLSALVSLTAPPGDERQALVLRKLSPLVGVPFTTLWRWFDSGVGGRRLDGIVRGRLVMSSVLAVNTLLAQLTEDRARKVAPAAEPKPAA